MKTNSLILLALIASGALFATLAPALMKDKLYGVATFATDERRCFNFHKDNFNDPDSAYVEHSYISDRKYDHPYIRLDYKEMLKVTVRAKNGMGAYVKEYVSCPLVEGRFNETDSRSYESSLVGYKLGIPQEGELSQVAPD